MSIPRSAKRSSPLCESSVRVSALDRLYFVSLVPHEQTVQPSLAENWWRCTEYVEHGKGKFEQLAVGKSIDVSGMDTRLKTVRVVHRPLSGIFKEGDRLIYAPGGKGKLWACITNSGHRTNEVDIDFPFEALGTSVDKNHLWVFRNDRIACASHEQVFRGKFGKSDWMVYDIPDNICGYTQAATQGWRGLYDLFACDDGTLVAMYFDPRDRRGTDLAEEFWRTIFTMTPKIDVANRKLSIEGTREDDRGNPVKTHGWIECWGHPHSVYTGVHKVFKQPIFCWEAMGALTSALERNTKL